MLATLQVWTKTVLTLHLQCLVITPPGWCHLGISCSRANCLVKAILQIWAKIRKDISRPQTYFSQKSHPLSVRGSVLYLMLKHKHRITKKMTSQSTHFTKLEYTYHGPIIYFFSCRSTNIIQLFRRYVLNWAHDVWKSHGTTVTPPGSTGFMLNSKDTVL